MKPFLLSSIGLFLAAVSLSTARADTAMETSMKQMSADSKQLGPDLKLTDDAKHAKDLDLKSVADLKANALKSRALVPKKEKTLPPAQQDAMTKNFQTNMDFFVQDIDTLNADIMGNKWDAARADFQKLMDEEQANHKLFRIKK